MRSPHFLAVALSGASGLLLLGCGSDHDAMSSQTIDIAMTDNAFQPTQFSVSKDETVTLRFTNDGTARHEGVLGDDSKQQAHHEQMSASTVPEDVGHGGNSDHGSGSGDADVVTVEPGETGSITTTFDESGTILIGCHEPGHWEAGMKATINVR